MANQSKSAVINQQEAQQSVDAFSAVISRCPGIPEHSMEAFAADLLISSSWRSESDKMIEWAAGMLSLDKREADFYAPLRAVTQYLSLTFEIVQTASYGVEIASDGTIRIPPQVVFSMHGNKHAREQMDFDPNEFVEALSKLCLRQGYTLDFVYEGAGNSRPYLYTRKSEAPRIPSSGLLRYFTGKADIQQDVYSHYLVGVECDDTPLSYFQLAVLDTMGEQFALGWHCNYNDWRIVCTNRELVSLSRALPASDTKQAKNIDLTIAAQYLEDTVIVTYILFSKWRGFVRRKWAVTRKSPHQLAGMKDEVLVPYDCGIFF